MHKPTDAIGYVPWRSGSADVANREACALVEHGIPSESGLLSKLCAIVVPIALPQEQDTEQFALLADGDSMYLPTEPVLRSKRTGEGVI
jgi:hypothetical protein